MPESRKLTEKERGGRDAQTDEAQGRGEAAAGGTAASADVLDERMLAALEAAADKKALDLIALDLREVASFTDVFLIASGTNVRQVQAVADGITDLLRKRLGVKPSRVEGYNSAEWVLLDYGDFIFHVFEEKSRRFYDLERLWRDAARVPLPPEQGAPGGGSLRDER